MIFWYGGREVLSGRLTAGDLVAFIVYALNISRSVGQASRLYTAVNTAAGASERLFELQQEKIEYDSEFNNKTNYRSQKIKGNVQFDQLSFSYEDGKEILDSVSFEIKEGQTVALVGRVVPGKQHYSISYQDFLGHHREKFG